MDTPENATKNASFGAGVNHSSTDQTVEQHLNSVIEKHNRSIAAIIQLRDDTDARILKMQMSQVERLIYPSF